MSRHFIPFLLLLVLAPPLFAQDKGYKVTRPDGTVEFTDQAAPGAKEIALPKSQGYEAPVWAPPSPPTPATTAPTAGKPTESSYRRVAITAPAQDETLRDIQGVVPVSVQVEPALHSGHRIVVLLDGKEVARGSGTHFTLQGVERGTHVLGAEVQDAQGKQLQAAKAVTFYVFQYSALHKKLP